MKIVSKKDDIIYNVELIEEFKNRFSTSNKNDSFSDFYFNTISLCNTVSLTNYG